MLLDVRAASLQLTLQPVNCGTRYVLLRFVADKVQSAVAADAGFYYIFSGVAVGYWMGILAADGTHVH